MEMGEVGESSTPGVGLKRVVVVPLVEFGSADRKSVV